MAPHSSFWCTFIQTKVFPALGGGIELPKTCNKTNDPSCSEWNVWHDIVIPPACFTLSCVRMDSRMLSGGQEDRDLTVSSNTRLRLLTPFLNTWRLCFPSSLQVFSAIWKVCSGNSSQVKWPWKLPRKCMACNMKEVSYSLSDVTESNLWRAEIISVSVFNIASLFWPGAETSDKQTEWEESNLTTGWSRSNFGRTEWPYCELCKWLYSHSALANPLSISGLLAAPQSPFVSSTVLSSPTAKHKPEKHHDLPA